MTQLPEEAIEAGARALHAEFSRAYGIRGTIWDDYKLEARATIHAAYPAIEKQVRAEVAAEIAAREFAVASVHHFGFGKNGHKCLCGFSSPINRERTEHIIDMLGATKIAKGETK